MLDMGFIPDIENICTKLPANRQTLLFSATMPPPIKKLSDRFLSNPKYVEVARPASASINITQWLVNVDARKKRDMLRRLLGAEEVTNAIVFCNRKTTVRELNKSLQQNGFRSGEIHGDIDQSSRIAELDRFKNGTVDILVASDVAARGLDIKGVSHVFNFDAPWHPDDYVHRIGRTGRAGAKGTAYTFVTPEDREAIDNIQKLIGQQIAVVQSDGESAPAQKADEKPTREKSARKPRGGRAADSGVAKEADKGEAIPVNAPATRVEKAPTPVRTARAAAPEAPPPEARRSNRSAHPDVDGTPEDGAWNGPVPDFLNFSLSA